ncbi:MAG: hypothetical protein J0M19_12860 [Sphingomonadales bacterium]|nr:hypothetical protein [Sphingomonadales bacterium]
MVDGGHQHRLEDLLRVRDAQEKAAAAKFGEAIIASQAAAQAVRDCEDERQRAFADWLDLLQANQPDPTLAALRGRWLVQQQEKLQSEELNSAIVDKRRDRSRNEYSSALALTAAAKKKYAQIQTSVAKKQEEIESLRLADAWLWRSEK